MFPGVVRFDYEGSGDDESEQDVLLERGRHVSLPSPPSSLPVPSIPPIAGFSQTQVCKDVSISEAFC